MRNMIKRIAGGGARLLALLLAVGLSGSAWAATSVGDQLTFSSIGEVGSASATDGASGMSGFTVTIPTSLALPSGSKVKLQSIKFGRRAATRNYLVLSDSADSTKASTNRTDNSTADSNFGNVAWVRYDFNDLELDVGQTYNAHFRDANTGAAQNQTENVNLMQITNISGYKVFATSGYSTTRVMYYEVKCTVSYLPPVTLPTPSFEQVGTSMSPDSFSTWFTGWDGEGFSNERKGIGPGAVGNVYVADKEESTARTPYKDFQAPSDFSFAIYTDASLVAPYEDGKKPVLWAFGKPNGANLRLRKDMDNDKLQLVAGNGAESVAAVEIDIPTGGGYHLYTATFSTTGGISLTVDGNSDSKVSNTSACTCPVVGFQIGSMYEGCVSEETPVKHMPIVALLGYDKVLSDSEVEALAGAYPVSSVVTGSSVMSYSVNNGKLYSGTMENTTQRLELDVGTLCIPADQTLTIPSLRVGNTSTGNAYGIELDGMLKIRGTSTGSGTGDSGNANIRGDVNSNTGGLLLGEWTGSGTYNIRGLLDAENNYMMLYYDAAAQTYNVNGGAIKAKGLQCRAYNTGRSGNATVNLTNGGTIEVAEVLSDVNAYTRNYGYGTLKYTGTATESNAINFNAEAGHETTLDPVANTLTLGTGVVTGSGDINVAPSGAGKVVFASLTDSYSGKVTISSGSAEIQGVSGYAGDIEVNAPLTIATGADDVTMASAISGTGAITKTGTGTLTITGSGTSSGTVTIKGGMLVLSGNEAKVGTGAFVVKPGSGNSATLKIEPGQGNAITLAPDYIVSSTDGNPALVVGEGTFNVASTGSSANGHFGQCTITIEDGGIMNLTKSGLLGTGVSSGITVEDGGKLQVSAYQKLARNVTLNGGSIELTGTATPLEFWGARTVTATADSEIRAVPSGSNANPNMWINSNSDEEKVALTFDVDSSATLDVNACIVNGNAAGSQGNGITKTGAGTLALNGYNGNGYSYSGKTTVGAGTLALNATHTTGSEYEFADGTTLKLSDAATLTTTTFTLPVTGGITLDVSDITKPVGTAKKVLFTAQAGLDLSKITLVGAPAYYLAQDSTTGEVTIQLYAAKVATGGSTSYYMDISDAFTPFVNGVATDGTTTLTILDGTALDDYTVASLASQGYYYDSEAGTITKAVATIGGKAYGTLIAAVADATASEAEMVEITLKRASYESVTLDAKTTVAEDSAGLYTGTLSGSGTLMLAATRESALNFGNWTGTVVLPSVTSSTYLNNNGFNFNFYGITGSTVRLSEGLSGQWLTSASVKPAVEIPAEKTFELGSFSPSFDNTFTTLRGEGAFAITAVANEGNDLDNAASWGAGLEGYSAYFRLGDVSEFTGSLTTTYDVGIALGASKPDYNTVGGKIYVYTPVTASDDWTAPNGIVLADANATLTVGAGATVTTDPAVSTTVADSYVKQVGNVYSVDAKKTVTVEVVGENVAFTGSVNTGDKFIPGETFTVAATADEYYTAEITVTGATVADGTVTVGESDITVTVTATRNTVDVVVPSVDNATVSVSYTYNGEEKVADAAGTVTIDQGTDVTVTYTAENGYFFGDEATKVLEYTTVVTALEITTADTGATSAAVAKIDSTYYPTLASAMSDATVSATPQSPVTVTMLTACTESATITVPANVTLDINGKGVTSGAKVVLNGGTLVNNGTSYATYSAGTDPAIVAELELTADSTVGGTGNFHIRAANHAESKLTLNGYTLTKSGTNTFFFDNTQSDVAGDNVGTINVVGGHLGIFRWGTSYTGVNLDCNVELNNSSSELFFAYNYAKATIRNLSGSGKITGSYTGIEVHITGSLTLPIYQAPTPSITLDNGSTLVLTATGLGAAYGDKLVVGGTSTVDVDLTALTINAPVALVSWTTAPAGSFTTDDLPAAYKLVKDTDGLKVAYNQYTLTVPEVANATAVVTVGGVEQTAPFTFDYGTVVTVTWTAAANYKITAGGTQEITLTENTEATAPTVELDVVTFAVPALANATVTSVTGATATGNANEYTATIGAAVVVTYTANDGYVFAGGATTTTVNWTAAAAAAPVAPASAPVVAVAKIGTTPYVTLKAAVNAAQAGDTVTLIANDDVSLTDGSEITIDKSLTITGAVDTNGEPLYTIYGKNTVTGYNDIFITGSGTVTLANVKVAQFGNNAATDMGHAPVYVSTSFTGTVNLENVYISEFNRGGVFLYGGNFNVDGCYIDCANARSGAFTKGIEVKGTATGTIADTEIVNMERSSTAYSSAGIEIYGNGTVVVDGCTIVSDSGEHQSTKATYGIVVAKVGVHDPSGGSLTVSNSFIDASNGALSVSEEYAVVVDGEDTYFGNYIATWSASSGITIKNGEFNEDVYADAGTITISGGVFNSFAPDTGANGTIAISGGVFDAPVSAQYCADGFIPADNGDGTYGVKEGVYLAQVGTAKFETLEAAFAAAEDGNTITVLQSCSGNGIKVPQGKFTTTGLTVDFDGYTYTMDGTMVGSTGTETQAFQLLKNNKITFKNGTIFSEKAKFLVQNYSDLTLDGMTLTLNNPNYAYAYTLSNNNGDIVINDTTINANPAGGFAFDVCRYASYTSVNVEVKGASVINGNVEVYASKGDAKDGFGLTLTSGTLNGSIVVDSTAATAMAATPDKATVEKAATFVAAAPADYEWVNGTTLTAIEYVAQTEAGKFRTLVEAVAQTTTGTITLLKDCEGAGIFVGATAGKNITIDFAGFTYTCTGPAVGSNGTQSQAFHLEKDNTIVLKGGMITATAASGVRMLVQNYSNLTLDGMILDGTQLPGPATRYVLSNNNGNVVIDGTTINAKAGDYAFDVCRYSSYPSVNVTVKGDSEINGNIELYVGNNDPKQGASLKLESGTVTGAIVMAAGGNLVVATKDDGVTLAAPEGYDWVEGVLTAKTYVAKIGTQGYETLEAAIAAVADGETVTLLDNVTLDAPMDVQLGSKAVTLDLGGETLTGRTNLKSGSLTIKNGTVAGGALQALNVYGSATATENYSVLTIADDVTVTADVYGVCLFGPTYSAKSGYGAVINIAGTVTTTGDSKNGAVFVSGNLGNYVEGDANNVINITGSITSATDAAIALNGLATVNVAEGASVVGNTAIAVKRGTLNVTGGTVRATGDKNYGVASYGNGTEMTGAAISMTDTYNKYGPMSVAVSGGVITSDKADALFKKEGTYANGATIAVSGGSFSSDVPETYLATGYAARYDEMSEMYVVEPGDNVAEVGEFAFETIEEAIAAVPEIGTTVKLLANVELTSTVVIDKDVTIDLNGKNIVATDARALWVKAGTVVLTGIGTISANGDGLGATSSVIRVGDGEDNTALAKLTVGEGVTVSTAKSYGISAFGKNARGIELEVFGKVLVTSTGKADAAISGNGTKGLASATITIKDGAEVSATNGAGIYFPGAGTLTVEGGSITGPTAVYVKSGNAKILGGTLTANGDAKTYKYKSNAFVATGDALVVESCGYPNGAPSATVTGGTLVSANAKAIGCYVRNSTFTLPKNIVPAKVNGDLNPARFGDANAMGIAAGYELVADGNTGLFKVSRVANDVEGTVDVVSVADTTLVAVPADCTANQLINTTNRSNGDILKVYVKSAGRYYTWELDGTAWNPVETWLVGGNPSDSTKVAAEVQLKKGEAVWVTRVDSSEPVLVNGSYEESHGTSAVTVEKGYNLVAPVPTATEAVAAEVVINEVVEKSEETVADKILVPATETSAPVALDCKVNETTGDPEWGYDYIETYVDPVTGKKRTRTVRKTTVTIPAGTGFWYINNSNTSKEIKL